MKKSLLALAALGAFATGAMAQSSSVTIYGIVDLGLVYQDRGESAATGSAATLMPPLGGVGFGNKLSVAQGAKSRLGFKGVEDLGGGYQAKFKLEHRLSPDTGIVTGTTATATPSFWDMSVVSLVTPVGEFGLGRDYMPAFYLQYLQDPWLNQGVTEVGGTTYGFALYNATGTAASRSARVNNAVFYSMQANGFTAQVAYSMKEDRSTGSANAGYQNRYGLGLQYAAGPLFVGLAYDTAEEVKGYDDALLIIGASYDFGMIKPRLTYARTEKNTPTGAGSSTPTTLTLAATAPLSTGLIKAGYAHLDYDGTLGINKKATKLSLGYEHTLSKRTALYTDITNGKMSGLKGVTAVDFGIRHMF
jgi:predicted porin